MHRGAVAVLTLTSGATALLITIQGLLSFDYDHWVMKLWDAAGVVPCWFTWMTIVLYFMARVTEVGDKQLKRLNRYSNGEELRTYASQLIEKDALSLCVAKHRWSMQVFNGLLLGLVLALFFIWIQGLATLINWG